MSEPNEEPKTPEENSEGEEEKVEEEKTEVELDDKALKAISAKVSEGMKADMTAAIKQTVEATLAAVETVDKKVVVDSGDKVNAEKGTVGTIKVKSFDASGAELGDIEVESKFANESKEMRLLKAARALANGDVITLNEYKEDAIAVRVKSGYMNETTDADGAVLVPYPDFDLTVHENLPKYGVAAGPGGVVMRTVTGNQVKQIGISASLSFAEIAEAGAKTSGKPTFNSAVKALRKFALIVPATDELSEDSAIDFWGLVTREMARALAKKQDELVFTDLTSGIAHTTGVITEPVTGAGTTITWDDMLNAENAIEDGIDTSNYKWFMRKETWNRLVQLKGTLNDHYIAGSLSFGWVPNNNNPSTPWGTPITFTRVLVQSRHAPNPGTIAIYGDLSYYTLYTKRGMVITALKEAVITDAGSSSFNLATQDATALRFVVRLLGFLNSNDASRFVILGVGTVS